MEADPVGYGRSRMVSAASYKTGSGTAELVLVPPPPVKMQPALAFGKKPAPMPPQPVPNILAQVDLCSWTLRLPNGTTGGITKFS